MKFAVNVPSHDLAREHHLEGMEQIIPIHVDATSKQEAINKALQITGGTEWHDVVQLEEETEPLNSYQVWINKDGVTKEVTIEAETQGQAIMKAVTGNPGWAWANRVSRSPKIVEEPTAIYVQPLAGAWRPAEGHAFWCRGDHEGLCQRGVHTGTERAKPAESQIDGPNTIRVDGLIDATKLDGTPNLVTHIDVTPTVFGGSEETAGMAEEPKEARQCRIQRDADKAAVVDLILSYRNPADEETRMRQIRVVME